MLILVGIGCATYFLTSSNVSNQNQRNFIVAEVTSDDGYPFEMTFPEGTTIEEIVHQANAHGSNIQQREDSKWIDIDPLTRIYEDIHIKVS